MMHVYPLNDLEDHDISDNGHRCKCNPEIILENGEMIVLHFSFDGREEFEEFEELEQDEGEEKWYEEILKNKN